MSIEVKYRLKEVAADFGLAAKEISEILAKYGEKPKSTTQALSADELNLVFDYLTQHNQISSLEVVFAVAPKPAEPKPAPVKEEQPKAEAKPAQAGKPQAAAQQPQKPKSPPSLNASGNAGWWIPLRCR